ncbi:hypothetical protein, partial [Flavobacterium sp.]|uniref:hypothetical protein n=1 Tax=Flavobacterium sp. TaxID=239 RepID=UPI00375092A9
FFFYFRKQIKEIRIILKISLISQISPICVPFLIIHFRKQIKEIRIILKISLISQISPIFVPIYLIIM